MALFDTIRAGSSGDTDFQIQRSLRFNNNDSTNLRRTPSSDGNRTTMTISVWVKRGKFGEMLIFDARRDDDNRTRLQFDAGNRMQFFTRFQDNSHGLIIEGRQRDVSAWYHLVWAIDTTQSTSSNRVKMYINGEQQSFISESNNQPDQNEALFINKDEEHAIGVGLDSGGDEAHFDGYMAEFNLIDGQQLTPSSFAETDSVTGEYKPIEYIGSYGTNGFYLNFSDNSNTTAATLGKDSSGNGHNFTPNNFSVSAGQGNDSLEDTPTNNYPTVNPLNSREPDRISNGNLDIDYTDSDDNVASVATFAMSSGKYYFEVLLRAGSSSVLSSLIGIAPDSYQKLKQNNQSAWPGKDSDSGVGIDGSGAKYVDGNSSTYGSSFTTNDVVGVAVDADAAKVAFSKNGQFSDGNGNYNQGANVASGGQVSIDGTGPYFPVFADTSSSRNPQFSLNFGQRAFSHSIPSGYQKLNSQNLPEPTVPRGDEYFDVLLWSGTNLATTRDITGLQFSPDWVWIKARNKYIYGGGLEYHHLVWDTVRGAGSNSSSGAGKDLVIDINTTRGEGSTNNVFSGFYGHVSSFNSDGFTVQKKSGEPPLYTDTSGANYVGWCWDAGSSTVTNTDGSVSAQVRANPSAGFSIITWTGTGSNLTIGHGLGVKPTAHITVARTGSSVGCDWFVYFSVLGATTNLRWNRSSTAGTTGQSDLYNDTEPTSSVITIGDSSCINVSGGTYVTYAFTDIEGYSKFGKYQGNGQSNGSYVHLGFRPAFLMIKTREQAGDWITIDSTRDVDNPNQHRLDANLSEAESSGDVYHDFLANGFKLRTGSASRNPSNQDMLYFAFAENPFKFARAR